MSIVLTETERSLYEALNALRRLDARDRPASTELILRIRNFIKTFRPDLFGWTPEEQRAEEHW